MADDLPDAPWAVAQNRLPDAPWVTGGKSEPPPDLPSAPWAAKTEEAGPMPGAIVAFVQGAGAGLGETKESAETLAGQKPEAVPETSPAAQPLEWSDLASPYSQLLPKFTYSLGKSSPTLAAGVAGGLAGSAVEPGAGTLVGGTIGAAAGAAFQAIGPSFGEELRKSPNDPDGAWTRAMERAGTSGLFSGAGWALFPTRFFEGPLKQFAFQAFGVQPGISAVEQATQNIIQGRPATENLGQAYAQGALGTAVPMAGHAALSGLMGKPETVKPATTTPETTPEEQAKPIQGELDFSHPETKAAVMTPDKPDMAPAYREIDFRSPVPDEGPDPSRWSTGFFGRQLSNMVDKWKNTFQPEMVSDLALQASGLFREYGSASSQQRDSIAHYMDGLHSVFEKLTAKDPQAAIDFMKAAAKEEGQVAPELEPYYKEFRQLLDMTYEADKNVGSKLGYIEDYFPRQFENPEKAAQFINARVKSMGSPGFQKARTLDLLQDGLDMGLKLVTTNPADLVTNRLLASAEVGERVKLLQRLNQMGAAAKLRLPGEVAGATANGWHLIKDPVGQDWAIHPDLKPMWDNVIATKGMWADPSIAGNMFRGWMKLKNSYVPLKLAISLFHPLHVAHINLVDGMTRGWTQLTRAGDPMGALGSIARGFYGQIGQAIPGLKTEAKAAREAWLTPEWKQTPEQRATVKLMQEGGFSPQLAEELRAYDTRGFRDALINQEWFKAIPYGLRAAMTKMQGAIFEHWIPSLKTAAYLDEARALFERRPDLIDDDVNRKAALSTIAKSIDNRYGEMFYRNLFWNKALKDIGIGSFLSLGWNLGFAREFGGGALEPFLRGAIDQTPTRKAIADAKSKTAFALFYMTNAMAINAMINKMMSGENPDGMDYFLPRIGGTNPDGSPRRISNMFYTREIPMAAKHIEEQQSVIRGLGSMLWNKMMFEPFAEMFNNKDYYGYNIWNESSPWYQQWGQLGKYILSDQFNPITISGAKRALQAAGKWNPDDSLLEKAKKIVTEPEGQMALAGFGPAPAYASKTATLNRLNYLFSRYVSPLERPQAEREMMEERRDARNSLALAKQRNDAPAATAATQRLYQLGVSSGAMKKVQPGTQDIYMFSRLPYSIQQQFLKELDKDDFKRYFPKANKMTRADPDIRDMARRYFGG